jgi:hypothetical protein
VVSKPTSEVSKNGTSETATAAITGGSIVVISVELVQSAADWWVLKVDVRVKQWSGF